jgi:hypothetical protein
MAKKKDEDEFTILVKGTLRCLNPKNPTDCPRELTAIFSHYYGGTCMSPTIKVNGEAFRRKVKVVVQARRRTRGRSAVSRAKGPSRSR